MNCYQHRKNPAIGICKFCMKGVCAECSTEVDTVLACKSQCEAEVKNINKALRNQLMIQKPAKAMRFLAPALLLLYGLYLSISWSGLLEYSQDIGFFTMGVVFIIASLLLAYRTFRKTNDG